MTDSSCNLPRSVLWSRLSMRRLLHHQLPQLTIVPLQDCAGPDCRAERQEGHNTTHHIAAAFSSGTCAVGFRAERVQLCLVRTAPITQLWSLWLCGGQRSPPQRTSNPAASCV